MSSFRWLSIFFNVCEEYASNIAYFNLLQLVDYGVSYASFVDEQAVKIEDLMCSGHVGNHVWVWRAQWKLSLVNEPDLTAFHPQHNSQDAEIGLFAKV